MRNERKQVGMCKGINTILIQGYWIIGVHCSPSFPWTSNGLMRKGYPGFCWCWSCACQGRPGGSCAARPWPRPWRRSWAAWCGARWCCALGPPCRPVPRWCWRLLLANNNRVVLYGLSHWLLCALENARARRRKRQRRPLITWHEPSRSLIHRYYHHSFQSSVASDAPGEPPTLALRLPNLTHVHP